MIDFDKLRDRWPDIYSGSIAPPEPATRAQLEYLMTLSRKKTGRWPDRGLLRGLSKSEASHLINQLKENNE